MCKALLFLLAATVAAPLAASWWPSWNPTQLQLVAGQSVNVTVQVKWSGLVGYNNPVDWSFRSDNNRVATASFHLIDKEPHSVQVTAVGPGTAVIRSESSSGLGVQEWVVIKVVCGAEPPVRPAAPVVQARLGRPFTLAVVSEIANRSQFAWYVGREGDRSHPLAATGPQIELSATSYGTQYVWVSAITPCSASSAEFRVEVVRAPRGRAAR